MSPRPHWLGAARSLAPLLLLLGTPSLVDAQVRISGRAIRIVATDTVAAQGARVVLHRVTPTVQGPIDSAIASADGRFRFTVRPDSGDIFLASARWGGVEYFGAPLNAAMLATDRESTVLVSDTSSSAPVVLIARQLVVGAPATDGTREVIDIYTFVNPGNVTRVSTSERPWSWRAQIPKGALEPHIDDSDFSREAYAIRGDSLLLLGAIPPGKHAVFLTYHLPTTSRQVEFPAVERAETLSVMAEERGLTVSLLGRGETREVDGKSFTEWSGTGSTNEAMTLQFPSDGRAPTWALPALVGFLVVVLGAAGVVATKRKQLRPTSLQQEVAPLPTDVANLLDRIAALDRSVAAGQGTASEQEHYQRERSHLKEQLRLALAVPPRPGGPPPAR